MQKVSNIKLVKHNWDLVNLFKWQTWLVVGLFIITYTVYMTLYIHFLPMKA